MSKDTYFESSSELLTVLTRLKMQVENVNNPAPLINLLPYLNFVMTDTRIYDLMTPEIKEMMILLWDKLDKAGIQVEMPVILHTSVEEAAPKKRGKGAKVGEECAS